MFFFFLGKEREKEDLKKKNSRFSLSLSLFLKTQKLQNFLQNKLTSAKIVGSSPYRTPVMLLILLASALACCRKSFRGAGSVKKTSAGSRPLLPPALLTKSVRLPTSPQFEVSARMSLVLDV